jgi:hypothetical protein
MFPSNIIATPEEEEKRNDKAKRLKEEKKIVACF